MKMTVGQIMAITGYLFGLSVAGYFIFRPTQVKNNES
jgi:hypothetical protein